MKAGYLSQYFSGVAIKELSAVEADRSLSNQHEFNGVNSLKSIFGNERKKFATKFFYLTDHEEPVVDDGFLTWYNSREGKPRSAEYRLYFSRTLVSNQSSAGDSLIIGMQPDKTVLAIITEKNSTVDRQVKWLFGLTDDSNSNFLIRDNLENESDRLVYTSSFILEQLGISVEVAEENFLEDLLNKFGPQFPSTSEFSKHARLTLPHVSSLDDPDKALMAWLEREEVLFRTLERYLLSERLNRGFSGDVDGFLKYSLSVQNRRKSRVGYAFENHVEQIWKDYGIAYSRGKITENNSKPDFLFPSIELYHDLSFTPNLLTMLGIKSTCKDRWRQVLSEADRISHKHLLTIEPAISENQTNEMKDRELQLIVPASIILTYSAKQQEWLMDLRSFIEVVKARQNTINA